MSLQLKQKLDNAVNLLDNDGLSELGVTCWLQTCFLFALYSFCYNQNCLQVLYSEPAPQTRNIWQGITSRTLRLLVEHLRGLRKPCLC